MPFQIAGRLFQIATATAPIKVNALSMSILIVDGSVRALQISEIMVIIAGRRTGKIILIEFTI